MLDRRSFLITTLGSAAGSKFARTAADATEIATLDNHQDTIPSVDDLAAQWCGVSQLRSLPSIHNAMGAAATGTDILSINALTFPPLAFGGNSAQLLINGKPVPAEEYCWYPYQILRRGFSEGVMVSTSTGMSANSNGVQFRVEIHNPGAAKELRVLLDFQGLLRQYPAGWAWPHPMPHSARGFHIVLLQDRSGLEISDSKSPAVMVYRVKPIPQQLSLAPAGARGIWSVNLAANDTWRIDLVLMCGQWSQEVHTAARAAMENIDAAWSHNRRFWQSRFDAAFTPGNSHFSGSLPRLRTTDKKISRMYYMSVASVLDLYRTSMPICNHAYVTGSPQDGSTLMYFWDTSLWATVFALLDPAALKHTLLRWLKLDIHSCYAQDCLTGKGVGLWYSFNDYAVFSLFLRYVCVTGDWNFLLEPSGIGETTVMEVIDQMAVWWRKLVRPGTGLADYGQSENLLECVPSYVGIVPSLNAANVFMMQQTAWLWQRLGQRRRAAELQKLAHELAGKVLGLYMGGQGYWACVHADGTRVPVRTCIDFFTITQCMAEYLSPTMRRQMIAFVSGQLLTDHWMRALSPQDPAAKSPAARRPDHGWTGAYDAWPPYTAEAMAWLGAPAAAMTFLRRCEGVTHAGPYGQSHELIGRTIQAPATKTQMYDETAGGCFAEVIIRSVLGFYPMPGTSMLRMPRIDRHFSGTLHGVKYNGQYFDLTSSRGGIAVARCNKP